MKIKITESTDTDQHGKLPEILIGKVFNVIKRDDEGLWIEYLGENTLVLEGEYEVVEEGKEEQKHMSVMDTQKFIVWCNSIMDSLQDRIDRDFGSGMVDDLAKYNQTRLIRDAATRGEFNIRLMEDNE